MVSYAADLTDTLFFLHDHPSHFTAANALTAGGRNLYTMSTLTLQYYHVIVIHQDYPSRACKFLPVSAAEPFLVSPSRHLSPLYLTPDSADESLLATGSN